MEQRVDEVAARPESRRICDFDVPPALSHVADAIEKSRRILDLPENWDDEGSPAYSKDTWDRAVRFVLENALRLWNNQAMRISSPAIHHGPDGSIDIHWEAENHILLINIPAQLDAPAEYYGRNARGHEVKGTLDTAAANQWLMMWQME